MFISNEELINSILNAIDEGIVLLDEDNKVINFNKGFCKILYKCEHEIINKDFASVIECSDIGAFTKKTINNCIKEVRNYQEKQKTTISLIDKEGKTKNLELLFYPLTSENKRNIVVVVLDITEKKLIEDQLNYIQKMETIGQLAVGIAHDFNNLLTAVIGFASFIEMNLKEDDPLKAYAKNILYVADRGAKLVKNLLMFSRKREFYPQRVELRKVFENISLLIRNTLGENIELKINLSKEPLPIVADVTQLEQAILNVVSNSKDAIERNGVVEIFIEKVEINVAFIKRYGFGSLGEYALIKIKDNGCGMDKETLKRVFEPFYTTKEAGKGTGLGMSIVYSIVKQHNGFITVESEKGKGTEVNIYLPLVVEERICEAALKEVFSNIKGGTETILVAEDDEYVRNLIYEVLTKAGYTVVLAKDGDEAVKKFLKMKNNIDLVILDVIMPYKNGGEVFSEISLANPLIKAIFLSGYSLDFINSHLLSSKKVIFMAKPISPKDLLLKVREVLDEVKSC